MSVSEIYRYTLSEDEELFPTFQHISRFYDIAKWQDKFLDVYAFARERIDMTLRRSYRYNPLNYAELKDVLDNIERHYDLAKAEGEVLQIYVFVKDGKGEETHLSKDPLHHAGETSFQN